MGENISYYTIKEAALLLKRFRISERMLYTLIESGDVPSVQPFEKGRHLIPVKLLNRMINEWDRQALEVNE